MSLTSKIRNTMQSSQSMKDNDGGPKYRIEHSISDRAGCQKAKCRREGVKIQKGELRLGTNGFWEQEQKWRMTWKHWACITPAAIKGVKLLAGNKPEEVPGFATLSPEAQEQLRLAFEVEMVPDKDFKGTRADLAKGGGGNDGTVRDVQAYKVEAASTGRAGCRAPTCKDNSIKILKGELRVGFLIDFDGEHMTWQYKHWNCLRDDEVVELVNVHQADKLEGIRKLSEQYNEVVMESLQERKRLQAPSPEPSASKTKKPRASKKGNADEATGDVPESSIGATAETYPGSDAANIAQEASTPAPKGKKKRAAAQSIDASENEKSASKKKRSHVSKKATVANATQIVDNATQVPTTAFTPAEVVDPAVAKIEALAAEMRVKAGQI